MSLLCHFWQSKCGCLLIVVLCLLRVFDRRWGAERVGNVLCSLDFCPATSPFFAHLLAWHSCVRLFCRKWCVRCTCFFCLLTGTCDCQNACDCVADGESGCLSLVWGCVHVIHLASCRMCCARVSVDVGDSQARLFAPDVLPGGNVGVLSLPMLLCGGSGLNECSDPSGWDVSWGCY